MLKMTWRIVQSTPYTPCFTIHYDPQQRRKSDSHLHQLCIADLPDVKMQIWKTSESDHIWSLNQRSFQRKCRGISALHCESVSVLNQIKHLHFQSWFRYEIYQPLQCEILFSADSDLKCIWPLHFRSESELSKRCMQSFRPWDFFFLGCMKRLW